MTSGAHHDFGGFLEDSTAMSRRQVIGLLGAAGFLAACGAAPESTPDSLADPVMSVPVTDAATAGTAVPAGTAGAAIPSETQGPYPADGSNGPNVLTDGAVVRSDLTTSFGGLSGTAEGIPASVTLSIVDAATGKALPGAAVYLWHCTSDGRYSIYEVTDQNYLRGLQVADEAGKVTFSTVFPGCYSGRWPHCHFEVFDSIDAAGAGANARKTSQLALPEPECAAAYADSRYGNSASNLGRLSLAGDNVFADGWTEQLATVSGSAGSGFGVSLLVRV